MVASISADAVPERSPWYDLLIRNRPAGDSPAGCGVIFTSKVPVARVMRVSDWARAVAGKATSSARAATTGAERRRYTTQYTSDERRARSTAALKMSAMTVGPL